MIAQQNPKVSVSLCLSPITHGKQQQLKPHSRIIKCLFSIEEREGRAKKNKQIGARRNKHAEPVRREKRRLFLFQEGDVCFLFLVFVG